jgi:hypothetical protein
LRNASSEKDDAEETRLLSGGKSGIDGDDMGGSEGGGAGVIRGVVGGVPTG